MDFFQNNIKIFSERFPAFAEKVKAVDISTVEVGRAETEGVFYAIKNTEGNWAPITNHINPGGDAQKGIDKMQHRLSSGLAPAVVIGLSPGYVLDSVYRHFKSRMEHHEPFRHIYVIIDSIACLIGWMKYMDRTEILSNPAVLFFNSDEVFRIVELCEQDEQRSHLFIPVTELDEAKAENLISPLASFYIKREKEYKKWTEEVNDYYDSIDDNTLIEVISGRAGRKPRLLMPTHSTSTVVQYSTRDTCLAFEKLGWETKILRMERDLSQWRITKEIREFRPDVFLFINHLRTENENIELYPRNMMFITWIQDAMPVINQKAAAEKWAKIANEPEKKTGLPRKRDILIGYVGDALNFGYPKDRGYEIGMIVNTSIFRKQEISADDRKKYECEICFASHRGKPLENIVRDELAPMLASNGISDACLMEISDYLTAKYKEGFTFISYEELKTSILDNVRGFADIWYRLDADGQNVTIQRLFWMLNDVIYRNTVLEWCDELGINLHIYGRDWDKNPRFSKYAKGELNHGSELSKAYQCAKFGLHLNSIEGTHQRPLEIISSGGVPIWRCRNKDYLISPNLASALRKTVFKLYGNEEVSYVCTDKEREELIHFLFSSLTVGEMKHFLTEKKLLMAAKLKIETRLASSPDWLIPNIKQQTFTNKKDLEKLLQSPKIKIPYGYMISNVNDIGITERIREFILSFLGSEDDTGTATVFESKINNVLNSSMGDILGFIKAIAQSNTGMILEKSIQPHITPILKLFATEKLVAENHIDAAGKVVKTISPDALFDVTVMRRLFYLLCKTANKEQALETAEKLTTAEDKVWIAESFTEIGENEAAVSAIRFLQEIDFAAQDFNFIKKIFGLGLHHRIEGVRDEVLSLSQNYSAAETVEISSICLNFGNHIIAGQLLKKSMCKLIDDPVAGIDAAVNLFKVDLIEESIELFNKIERDLPSDGFGKYYLWRSIIAIASHEYDQALNFMEKNMIQCPRNRFSSIVSKAYILFLKGCLDIAEKELRAIEPQGNKNPDRKIDLKLNLARILRTKGDLKQALAIYSSLRADALPGGETAYIFFEELITLESLGDLPLNYINDLNSKTYGDCSNLNKIFALRRDSREKKSSLLFLETARLADLSYYNFPPHVAVRPWLKLVAAVALDNAGEVENAKKHVLELMEIGVFLEKSIRREIADLIAAGEYWRSEKCASKIAEAVFSNLPENCFDRQWIKNECLKKD